MILNITYNGKPYRVIKKKNAYVFGISMNDSTAEALLDLDKLTFDEGFVKLYENLPGSKSLELTLVMSDEETIGKYAGLPTLDISFGGIHVTATL